MLILTRGLHEVIRIAGNIRVVVLSRKGDQIRIGIEAPDDVVVDREEVHFRKLAELQAASLSPRESPPA
jgi:carbon storage regulator